MGAGCRRTVKVPAFPDTYVGIGVELRVDGELPVIVRTLPGGSSDAAGLKTGDKIVAIDGKATAGMTLGAVVSQLRGAPDSEVQLALERAGNTLALKVRRQSMHKSQQDYRPD